MQSVVMLIQFGLFAFLCWGAFLCIGCLSGCARGACRLACRQHIFDESPVISRQAGAPAARMGVYLRGEAT